MTRMAPRQVSARAIGSVHRRTQATRCDPDRGSTAMWLAVVMVGLIAMAGLVFDGGAALQARGRAADLAQQAARAGADALDPDSVFGGGGRGRLRAQRAAAQREAQAVLSASGVSGEVQVAGDAVTVTAHTSRPTAILTIVGISEVTGTASATAIPLLGTTSEGR